jgi:tRNA nucleotidyltransferase/poly(A) polymerase
MAPEAAAVDPLLAARAHFARVGAEAWLVGGRVRDGLLGRWTVDTDIVVRSDAFGHAARIATRHGGAFVALDARRGIARVVWPARSRGAAPRGVLDLSDALDGDLEADLRARDFTINALALPLDALAEPLHSDASAPADASGTDLAVRGRPAWLPTAGVIDIVGGRADLFARRLRLIDPGALDADPLRLLRAPRLAAQLGFEIEPGTRAAILARAERVREPAAERVREELLRLLACDPPEAHVELLHSLGLLVHVLPELDPAVDGGMALVRGLAQLDAMARLQACLIDRSVPAPSEAVALVTSRHRGGLRRYMSGGVHGGKPRADWLRLAALLAGTVPVGAPQKDRERGPDEAPADLPDMSSALATAVGARLRLGNAELVALTAWLTWSPWVQAMAARRVGPTLREQHRFYRHTGGQGVAAVLLALALNAADKDRLESRASLAATADRLLTAWFERHEEIVAPTPLVDGRALLAGLAIKPGPLVGQLLEALLEAQAAGEVLSKDEALDLARRLLKST